MLTKTHFDTHNYFMVSNTCYLPFLPANGFIIKFKSSTCTFFPKIKGARSRYFTTQTKHRKAKQGH